MPCAIGKALLVSKRDNYLFPLKIKDALPIGGDKHGRRRTNVLLP
jgi:hypothetical protein